MTGCATGLAAFLCPAVALAAAWTLEPSQTKAFITSSFSYGDHGFDDNGELVTAPEYRKFRLSASLEHGVRPWLTAIARGELTEESIAREINPYLIAPVPQTFASVGGGARLRLHKAPNWVFSTELTVFSGGFTSYGAAAPSDGAGAEARALFGYGTSVAGRPVFADLQAAYRTRLEKEEPDEVKLDLTLGAQVLPRWLLLGQAFSTFELGGDANYHKVSGSVVRRVNDRLSVEASAFTTVAGRNALKETGGKLSFWYTLGGEPQDLSEPPRRSRLGNLLGAVRSRFSGD